MQAFNFMKVKIEYLAIKMNTGIKVFKFADLMCFKIASFYHHPIAKKKKIKLIQELISENRE